jgi:hypothetical protein
MWGLILAVWLKNHPFYINITNNALNYNTLFALRKVIDPFSLWRAAGLMAIEK